MTRARVVTLVLALAVAAAMLTAGPAQAASPTCSAVLFTPTDGDAFVVEQPDSAPGAIYCTSDTPVTFGVATAPGHGMLTSLVPNETGGATFDYTPNLGYTGPDQIVLSADNGDGPPTSVSVAVSVRPAANDAPECTASLFTGTDGDAFRTETGKPVAGHVECFDDEGDPSTISLSAAPDHGSVTGLANDGSSGADFTYTPGSDPGSDSFAFTASDGTSTSAPAVIDVEIVAAGNDPPTCSADMAAPLGPSNAFEVEAGSAVDASVLCDDPDGDKLDFEVSTPPAHGALAPLAATDGQAVETAYTPEPGFEGYDLFRVSVDDGVNAPQVLTVRIRVVPDRNDAPRCSLITEAPVLSSGRYRIEQGTAMSGRLDCTDETAALTYGTATAPSHGSLSSIAADGKFTYTASATFAGQDDFTLSASDGENVTPIAVHVKVMPAADDPPACEVALPAEMDADGAYTVPAGRSALGRVVCSDDGTGDLAFSVAAASGHGTVSGLANDGAKSATFSYKPATGYVGADSFTIGVSDGVNPATPVPVKVSVVQPSPAAPRCTGRLHTPTTPNGYEVEEGETVQGTITCFDADGDDLSFVVTGAPTRGTLSTLDGSDGSARFTYTAGSQTGTDRIALVATDGTQSSNVVSLDIDTVAPYDSPPECQIGLFATPLESAAYPAENQRPNPGVVSCVDDEQDDLDFEVVDPPDHGRLDGLNGQGEFAPFSYVANDGYVGPDAATVRVRDGSGHEVTEALHVVVGASSNTAPSCTTTLDAPLSDGAYTLAAGASAAATLTCTDAESDAVTISVAQSPARATLGALTGTGGERTFTVNAPTSAVGADTFVLHVVDALGAVTDVPTHLYITAAAHDPGPSVPPTSTTPAQSTDPTPTRPATPLPAAPRLRGLKVRAGKKHTRVLLTFTAAKGQGVSVVLRTRVKRKLVIVGRATKTYTRAGKRTLDVKLNSAGLKRLKKQEKLALKIAVTTTAKAHSPTTITRSFALRR